MPAKIILNADDFGYDTDTVRATIECFDRGGLTSATIMPRMPATLEAIAYARAHPEFSFGVHLTLVSEGPERPLCAPAEIPDLVDASGTFFTGRVMFPRAFRRQLPVDQLAREMTAQIGFLRDYGVTISHVDSHGHLHKFAPCVAALERVLPKFGIERVRRGQNVWLKRPWRSPTFWVGGAWHPRIDRRFRTTERFFMPICPADRDRLPAVLRRVRGTTLEIGVHPGYADPYRDHERRVIQQLGPAVAKTGHRLATWAEI